MNGLEYLKSSNILQNINETLEFDILDSSLLEEIKKELSNKIQGFSDLQNLNEFEKKRILNYLEKIEKNPKIFEKDLKFKLKSHNKKILNGNFDKGLLEGILEILLEKKPSKSKYTRKRKKR